MRLLTLLLVVLSGWLAAQSANHKFSATVYFGTAESQLDAEARRTIGEFTDLLAAYADFDIRLEAFTDERGETHYNEELARDRAASVRTHLSELGITPTGLTVTTWGERKARRGTDSEAELQSDRRVDLVATVTTWSDLDEVVEELKREQQQSFTVDPTESYTVEGDRGGRFLIDPNSFVDEAGNPPTGAVTVSLTEAYTFGDMLLAGLTTHSGDRLLETGGMFRLTATDEAGNELRLADGKTIAASIPTEEVREDMRFFMGEVDPHSEEVDWTLTNSRVVTNSTALLGTATTGPVPQNVTINLGAYMSQWVANNPRPVPLEAKKLPRERPVAVFPDTAAIEYRARGLEGIFLSADTRRQRRARLVRNAVNQYERDVRARERSIRLRSEYAAFNSTREARNEAAYEAWEQRRQAYYDEISESTRRQREALQRDYEKRLRTYRDQRAARLEQALRGDVAADGGRALKRYFVAMSSLGWANCDIFWDNDDPVEVLAEIPNSDMSTMVVLLPEGRRSILRYFPGGGNHWRCRGIPRGSAYQVLAYRLAEGRIEYARQRVAAAGTEPERVDFEPVSLDELKALLREVQTAK